MSNRFWKGKADDSSDNESDRNDSSDEEVVPKFTRNWGADSDSDSEDEHRVVRSAKEKAFEKLHKLCGATTNHMKINDWTSIHRDFDLLVNIVEKSKTIIATHGYPTEYIKLLCELEDLLNDTLKNKQAQKKMTKEVKKSFIRMKSKLKKHNVAYEKEISNYRENPTVVVDELKSESIKNDLSSSDSESASDESSEDESSDESEQSKSAEEESESDSDSWPSDSSASSNDEEPENQLKGRDKWLKSASTSTEKKTRKVRIAKPTTKVDAPTIVVQVEKESLKLSPAQFDCRLKEIVAGRGKRSTDNTEQLGQLRTLVQYARKLDVAREICALMHLLGAEIVDTANKIDKVLSARLWHISYQDLDTVMKLLEQNPGFRLAPLSDEDQADIMRAGKGELVEEQGASNDLPVRGGEGIIRVAGNLEFYVERLYDEYRKDLQNIDHHYSEYVVRLRDEAALFDIEERVQNYYIRCGDYATASSLAQLRAELMYYKHDTIAKAIHISNVRRKLLGNPDDYHPACLGSSSVQTVVNFDCIHPGSISGPPVCDVPSLDTEAVMRELCLFVYKYGNDRSKTRAMLCHVYHHAIHDRFHQAKDLLLMSHLQESISSADVPTQILFNRMMAQLGLCAFRKGYINEAHSCLTEVCIGTRVKELLAQGLQRTMDKNSEQEKAERRRQIPYHMHINLDLLECCHLTSAMLLEVPNIASANSIGRQRVISKTFRRYVETDERQVFVGPPENTRDHVIAAAKALLQGNWKKASDLVLNLSVWTLFPGAGVAEKVKEMVKRNIQIEALRTYLLAFSSEYDSMSLPQLCIMFELPENTVHSVVSKMMINEELFAAWDQPSRTIVFHKVERSRLQTLALRFADKTAMIVENNEKLLDIRSSSSYAIKDDWNRRTDYNRTTWNQRTGQQSQKNFTSSRGQYGKGSSGQYNNKKGFTKKRNESFSGSNSNSRGDYYKRW